MRKPWRSAPSAALNVHEIWPLYRADSQWSSLIIKLLKSAKSMVLRTVSSVILLLLVPAFVYCASVYRHGHFTYVYLVGWFVENYVYMAAPHLLMLLASIVDPRPRSVLPIILVVLNVILVLFQCWIWFVVPGRESGLAWMFYIPAWILGLGAVYVYCYFAGKQHVRS